MPRVTASDYFMRQHHAVAWIQTRFSQPRCMKQRVITLGRGASSMVPSVDVAHFYFEDSALKPIHASVPADFVVIVTAAHSVLAQHPHPLSQFSRVRRHHA